MDRRNFLKDIGLLGAGLVLDVHATEVPDNSLKKISKTSFSFPLVRKPLSERRFVSEAVEDAIRRFKKECKNDELKWMFENCFPNTLDTTVFYSEKNGRPETYVITGDIDAMWLRDSSAQVYPYLHFVKEDDKLRKLIAGVINKQTKFLLKP